MYVMRDDQGRRADRRRGIAVEPLEGRSLMTTAAATFTGPSLTGLLAQVERGKNEDTAITNRLVTALETQLQAGPLADLDSNAVAGTDFIAEAQGLESSFEQDVAQQLSGDFAKKTERLLGGLTQVLDLDGQRVVANLVALGQEDAATVINNDEFAASAQAAIASLTGGPIHPLGTPLSGLASTTLTVESQLATLAQDLASGLFTSNPGGPNIPSGGSAPADPAITTAGLDKVNLTLDADLESYRASVHAATLVGQPGVAAKGDAAINKLEAAVSGIGQDDFATATSVLNSGITAFDAAVLGKTGVFGPRGAYSRAPKAINPRPGFSGGLAASAITNVAGTANLTTATKGTASLTATLATAAGSAVPGQVVNFTVDGVYIGSATTDSAGVATLSGLTTTDASGSNEVRGVLVNTTGVVIIYGGNESSEIEAFGTNNRSVVATFAGSTKLISSQRAGDLVVSDEASGV